MVVDNAPQPLVSVILPVLNAERFLREALDCLAIQTYPHYEILAVDGGSTDRTLDILAGAARLRVLSQTEPGLAQAWNTGVRAAQGDFICFLDADDLWPPDKLTQQVTFLTEHPELEYVIARVQLFLEPGCPRPAALNPAAFEGDHLGRMPGTLMARRRLFDQIGLFDPRWPVASDTEWFARLETDRVPGAALARVLLRRRIHERNLTHVSGARQISTELLEVLKRHLDLRRQRAAREKLGPDGL